MGSVWGWYSLGHGVGTVGSVWGWYSPGHGVVAGGSAVFVPVHAVPTQLAHNPSTS